MASSTLPSKNAKGPRTHRGPSAEELFARNAHRLYLKRGIPMPPDLKVVCERMQQVKLKWKQDLRELEKKQIEMREHQEPKKAAVPRRNWTPRPLFGFREGKELRLL